MSATTCELVKGDLRHAYPHRSPVRVTHPDVFPRASHLVTVT